ncbi:MAG TPA: hypothetical protein VLU91_01335 [Nitrososphaerales archaeon]|nr:hypothetical protein [Nitrososphaerales archaeon]
MNDSDLGFGAKSEARAATYSAAAPSRQKSRRPYTSSPPVSSEESGPTSSTVPATSNAGIIGNLSLMSLVVNVEFQVNSVGVTPAAWTFTSASPGPASGLGASS